jgi:hypothetical protein
VVVQERISKKLMIFPRMSENQKIILKKKTDLLHEMDRPRDSSNRLPVTHYLSQLQSAMPFF